MILSRLHGLEAWLGALENEHIGRHEALDL